jgi:O-antigen ligase
VARVRHHPLAWLPAAAASGILVTFAATSVLPQAGSLPLVVAVGVLGLLVAAVLTRPADTLVASFLLLAVVRIEPAPVDLMLALLVATAVALGAARVRMPSSVLLAVGAYLVLTILSMVNSLEFSTAIRFNAITIFLLVVAVWLTGVFSEDAATARRAMKAYVLGATVTAVAGVAALQLPLPGREILLYDAFRTQGLFKDPNVFAPFLVPAACLALEEYARPRLLGWSRRRCALVVVVLAAGILFGFSRAAWLNFLLASTTLVVVYALRRHGLRAAMRSASALAVLGLAGLAMLVATGSAGFFESRTTLQGYDERRFATQGEAYGRMTDHVFGYGPGQSEPLLAYAPHSTYARVAIEQGALGLAAIVLVFAATMLVALRLAIRDRALHGIGSATLLAAWVGLVTNSFFVDTLHWRHLWIVAALVWCAGALPSRSRDDPPPGEALSVTRRELPRLGAGASSPLRT